MKKWRKEWEQGFEKLRNETRTGSQFELRVIPATQFDKLIADGNKGDMIARRIVTNLNDWFAMAEAAARDGTYPACCSCATPIEKGYAAGWVVMTPTQDGTGMIGCFCPTCYHKGPDTIAANTLKLIADHGEVMSLH